jgi:hypothetical protein
METPQITITPDTYEGRLFDSFNPKMLSLSYGLTLFMNAYRGEHVVWHYGETDGMKSALGMIPDRHLGVVVMSNLQGSWLPVALMYRVFDDYLGAPKQDWSKKVLRATEKFRARPDPVLQRMQKARIPNASPPLPLSAYTGTYTDKLYGKVTVSKKNEHLVLKRGWLFIGDLQPWDYNTFRVVYRYRYLGKNYVEFELDPTGHVSKLSLLGNGTFTRRSANKFNVIERH